MNKLVKYLLLSLSGVAAVLLIAIFVLLVVIDPNRYKPALESLFAQQTGLRVNIAGDIAWSFRPVFGFTINDVRVTNGVLPQELASFSAVALKVVPRSIFSGNVQITEFVANDLHVNWLVDANGVNNWFPEGMPETADNSISTPEQSDINAEIARITIRNARISVQDAQSGLNTSLENLELQSSDTNFSNRPFPFETSFRLLDYSTDQDLRVSLSTFAAIDYAAGNAQLNELRLALSPVILSGDIVVSNFHNDLSWQGNLSSNSFNLSHFLENFSAAGEGGQAVMPGNFDNSSEQFALQVSFSGNNERVSVPSLVLTLDDMRAQADIEYRFAQDNQLDTLIYQIDTNALDLNNYFGADSEEVVLDDAQGDDAPQDDVAEEDSVTEEGTPVVVATNEDIAIPVDLLRTINIIGTHSIDALAIAGLNFSDLNFQMTLNNGVLNIETQPMGFYEGALATLINLDARPAVPVLTTTSAMENVNVLALSEFVPQAAFARGRLSTESQYTLRGTTLQQMLDSMSGATAFRLTENSVDIGLIKQVFAAIAALSPSGEIARNWPDTLSFAQFDGAISFSEGLSTGQELQLRMDNFEVTGTGGIDLAAERFDYAMQFTVLGEPALQTIPVNPTFQGVTWPVQCRAAFSAEPRQYCSPDFAQVRDLFARLARNEVERRVQEAVIDQVPEQLQDRARGLLRDIFQR